MSNKIYIKNQPLQEEETSIEGTYVTIDNEEYYRISDYDRMRPFFISLVSHTDLWLFTSTRGGLSAGRKDANSAIFPYYTDDKITDSSEHTGSKTVFRVTGDNGSSLWEPFSNQYQGIYHIRRNLYKNYAGNKLIFEEVNHDLQLRYRFSWQFSEKFGLVKKASLTNLSEVKVSAQVLDGLQNLLPYGVHEEIQNIRSNLTNAYKKNELDQKSGLGLFLLSSIIVDRAEPSEALKATTVWQTGLNAEHILLCDRQLNAFRRGDTLTTEEDVRAEPGCYFVSSTLGLDAGKSTDWRFVADVNQDHSQVIALIGKLGQAKEELARQLHKDIEKGTQTLMELVAKSDGLQLTGDKLMVNRHYANVLFNIMRGGIFEDGYLVEKADLIDYANTINRQLTVDKADFFDAIGHETGYMELIKKAMASRNTDLIRVCYEYLPLSFSRRHGDPSRPWNKFSIAARNPDGSKIKRYEGNWRDIFQNWEVLGLSFPKYILSMISKFVNASTIDGYNPYRITREGIDWELIEPDDPWSYIGYWGDHQIIYLQKLMELALEHDRKAFMELFTRQVFVYANVPYRIKRYNDIVNSPQDTIDFDDAAQSKIDQKVSEIGNDGKLLFDAKNQLLKANLAEKLLVTLLAKLSNFVPEAGIWLNTQRPEWNDANNALVGNGVSLVTLCYIRRFTTFCQQVFATEQTYHVNEPIAALFKGMDEVFTSNRPLLDGAFSDESRKTIVDSLGKLGEAYRQQVYETVNPELAEMPGAEISGFLDLALEYVDHTIRRNKRSDDLYHAYNLISFEGEKLIVSNLYEMLEGQVAVLSAGLLNLEEALAVLDALKSSAMYREDQYSYMLYPDRQLPRFLEKNLIPKDFAERSALAKALIKAGNRELLIKDVNGDYHFNGAFNNATDVEDTLRNLKETALGSLVEEEFEAYLEVFEQMFNHQAFTGRSGTFYGYEGLGSIYWHMVSKLLVATQENIFWGQEAYQRTEVMGRMVDHYFEIRAGIGANKSPELYGSFPTDPYSHTPGNKGVQQPGMTGQVKEDILNRWAELGISVQQNHLVFDPCFLSRNELLETQKEFVYFDVSGHQRSLTVNSGELAFTYCQVPIVYGKDQNESINVHLSSGEIREFEGRRLDIETSELVFSRAGEIDHIRVNLKSI